MSLQWCLTVTVPSRCRKRRWPELLRGHASEAGVRLCLHCSQPRRVPACQVLPKQRLGKVTRAWVLLWALSCCGAQPHPPGPMQDLQVLAGRGFFFRALTFGQGVLCWWREASGCCCPSRQPPHACGTTFLFLSAPRMLQCGVLR